VVSQKKREKSNSSITPASYQLVSVNAVGKVNASGGQRPSAPELQDIDEGNGRVAINHLYPILERSTNAGRSQNP